MENEEHSAIIWCKLDLATNATQLRLVNVATGEEVHLNNANFLLRISMDAHASVIRCSIHHIASGRDAYVQGGSKLGAFVKECVLKRDEARPDVTDQPEA